jgi:hypothetical protein
VQPLTDQEIDRVIEMAWEDRTKHGSTNPSFRFRAKGQR